MGLIAHCLFEQSGTFKNEFKKLGIKAFDYDIRNDYGQTDYVIDLFDEILRGGAEEPSIFDDMTKDDIILAFFPCERFENQVTLWLQGNNFAQKNWNDSQKIRYAMEIENEVNRNYNIISTLFLICIERGLKLIVENPYAQDHFLVRYFPVKAKFIDNDRTMNGDYYKKPTQFWFVNCEPKHNLIFEPLEETEKRIIQKQRKVERSEIHPQYANRFIRQQIL